MFKLLICISFLGCVQNLNINCKNNKMELINSIKTGNKKLTKFLMNKTYKKDLTEEKLGESLLLLGIKYDNLEVVKFLLENELYSLEETYYLDEAEKVEFLEGYDFKNLGFIDPNYNQVYYEFKKSILCYAVESNSLEIVRFLLSKIVLVESEDYVPSILYAIKNNNLDMINVLIENGSNINSPLIYAIKHEKEEIINILLNNKANPNIYYYGIRYQDTKTALTFASEKGNINIVEMLIDRGAEINPKIVWYEPENIYTPLILASRVSKEIVELLLDNGADMNYCMECMESFSPLFEAANAGKLDIMQLLVSRGINTNLALDLQPVRHYIKEDCSKEILDFITTIDLDPSVKLYKSIRKKDVTSIKNILSNNDLKDKCHLRVAIESHNLKALKLLLNKNYSILQVDLNMKVIDTLEYITTLEEYLLDGDDAKFNHFFQKHHYLKYRPYDEDLSPISNLIYNYDLIKIMILLSNKIESIHLKESLEQNLSSENISNLFENLIKKHRIKLFKRNKIDEKEIEDWNKRIFTSNERYRMFKSIDNHKDYYRYKDRNLLSDCIKCNLIESIDLLLKEFNLKRSIDSLLMLGVDLRIKFNKKKIFICKKILNNLKINSYGEYNELITKTLSLNGDLFYEIAKRF